MCVLRFRKMGMGELIFSGERAFGNEGIPFGVMRLFRKKQVGGVVWQSIMNLMFPMKQITLMY